MALVEINWKPSRRELRQFALGWIAFFGVIGAIAMWAKHSPSHATVWWLVSILGLIGVLAPSAARPVYVTWMALALPIGWVVSHSLLALVYYLVLTPVGLLMRLFKYDPMTRQIDRSAKTYWTTRGENVDAARYFKQH